MLVASTYDGVPRWEPDWESIGKAVDALLVLQELPGHQPDWPSLLHGFTRLHVLADKTMGSLPLQDFGDFLQIGGYFLPFTSQKELPARIFSTCSRISLTSRTRFVPSWRNSQKGCGSTHR